MKIKNNIEITKAKNLVRGALSHLKALSTPSTVRNDWQAEQYAQQQINRALTIARSKLDRRHLSDFEAWVSASIAHQHRATKRLGVPLTSLGILPNEFESRDLITELNLTIDKLKNKIPELCTFARDALTIANFVSKKELVAAMLTLQSTILRDSYSYWAIETELALKQ